MPVLSSLVSAVHAKTLVHAALIFSLVAAIGSLFLFGWIAEDVVHDQTLNFDSSVRENLHRYASPPLTKFMTAVSLLGQDGLVVAFILVLLVFVQLRWIRAAVWISISMGGALVMDLTLKHAFHRPRPVPFFGPAPDSYSFPSGHALFSLCFYGVLAGLLASRIRLLPLRIFIWTSAAPLIFAIGLSRIYLGVHYPSDVIAGYLAASVWVSTILAVDRLPARVLGKLYTR